MTTYSPIKQLHTRRSSCQRNDKILEDEDVVQGRILWLPPKHELPVGAVRRAHGRGAIEEGIFNHPVVVVSRTTDEPDAVHFHIITSFGGKKLQEIYGKSNDFHVNRRSWYLPISPAPQHPDAISKKAKKRFPTLELADAALLRWESYVNLRDVYSIDWENLRDYGNPDTPLTHGYRFQRESMIRLLAKGKQLTGYFPDNKQVRQTTSGTALQLSTYSAPSPVIRSPSPYRLASPSKWDTVSNSSSEPSSSFPETAGSEMVKPFFSREPRPYGPIRSCSEQPLCVPEAYGAVRSHAEDVRNGHYEPHPYRPIISYTEQPLHNHRSYGTVKTHEERPDSCRRPGLLGVIRFIVYYFLKWPWDVLRSIWSRLWNRRYVEI